MLIDALKTVLDILSRDALRGLFLTPIEATIIKEELGRIGTFVQPAYLPFTRDSDESIALYLRPNVALLTTPIVRLDADNHAVQFLASSFADARTALCVCMARYAESADEIIDAARRIGGDHGALNPLAPDVIEALRSADFSELRLWNVNASVDTKVLWSSSALAHPFAHLPEGLVELNPEEARAIIETLVPEQSPEPELRSLRLRARAATGLSPTPEDVRAVLGAEAWRERKPMVPYLGHLEAAGLSEWDATLQLATKAEGALVAPFDRLRRSRRLYKGDNSKGTDLLMGVGRALQKEGDWQGALNQYRNAAAIAGLAGDFIGNIERDECFEAIANACDRIQAGSLAAEVARASARAYAAGL